MVKNICTTIRHVGGSEPRKQRQHTSYCAAATVMLVVVPLLVAQSMYILALFGGRRPSTASSARQTNNSNDSEVRQVTYSTGMRSHTGRQEQVGDSGQITIIKELSATISGSAPSTTWKLRGSIEEKDSNEVGAVLSTFSPAVSSADDGSSTNNGSNEGKETAHILLCLSGNDDGFMNETEIAIKSILLNAPLDYDLTIHVMADRAAYDALDKMFERTGLLASSSEWRTRNTVSIVTYNVEPNVEEWQNLVLQFFRNSNVAESRFWEIRRHTIGSWFRLFADKVLPSSVGNVIYMDTDVAVMANIEDLWRSLDGEKYVMHMGDALVAGFAVFNLQKMGQIWELASQVDLADFSTNPKFNPNPGTKQLGIDDQLVVRAVQYHHPELVGLIPGRWDVHATNGATVRHAHSREEVLAAKPEVGMIHYNGGGASKQAYFIGHKFCSKPEFADTLGLVKFYVQVPWQWARYLARAQTRDGHGHVLKVHHKV